MALEQFPAVLRRLLETEQAAGNAIAEMFSGFPAPPIGACILLARAVTTSPPEGVRYRARASSTHAGEFTDDAGRFYLLDPPLPAPDPPDMDAIRAARDTPVPRAGSPIGSGSARDRFEKSMTMTYERWHDGIGHDLDALREASETERHDIETVLLGRGVTDWRDIEALAALNSPRARVALRLVLRKGDVQTRLAVARHAPWLVGHAARIRILREGLGATSLYEGLTQTLLDVETFHPPAVIQALLRGVLEREGDVACLFAGMVLFVLGETAAPHDAAARPFCLMFNTGDRREREVLFRVLCERTAIDPRLYLK